MLPLTLAKTLVKTKLFHVIFSKFTTVCKTTVKEALDKITDNEELKNIMTYIIYMDVGMYSWYQIQCQLDRPCADPEGGGDRWSGPPPLKNHKTIGFLSNTGPDPLLNDKATKPAFNVGPPSARQRNAISMAFHWRADFSPLIVFFGCSLPSSTRKM